MVAVLVVPLVLLVAACLMERLEARVAPRAAGPAPATGTRRGHLRALRTPLVEGAPDDDTATDTHTATERGRTAA